MVGPRKGFRVDRGKETAENSHLLVGVGINLGEVRRPKPLPIPTKGTSKERGGGWRISEGSKGGSKSTQDRAELDGFEAKGAV